MKIISLIPRILLGLVFGVMPWMAILHLAPKQDLPPGAIDFTAAMMKTGYFLPLVWGTEIVAGILILIGVFVPFALVLLAPVLVNILLFHLFLAPSGDILAIVLCLLAVIVAWQYRRSFEPLFTSGRPPEA
jgi:uncharacterized membrane protein YphA (DoxX/SURF4 family)